MLAGGWLFGWVVGFLVWYMMVFSGFGILVRRLCVGLQYLWLCCWCQIRCAELFAGGFTLLGLFLLIVLVFIDSLHLYRLVTG